MLLFKKLFKFDGLKFTEIFFNSKILNWFNERIILSISGLDFINEKNQYKPLYF